MSFYKLLKQIIIHTDAKELSFLYQNKYFFVSVDATLAMLKASVKIFVSIPQTTIQHWDTKTDKLIELPELLCLHKWKHEQSSWEAKEESSISVTMEMIFFNSNNPYLFEEMETVTIDKSKHVILNM